MKCEHCGYELSMEQEVCPYCGKPNMQYVHHKEIMQSFSKDFQKTKEEVIKKSDSKVKTKSLVISAIIMLVACLSVVPVIQLCLVIEETRTNVINKINAKDYKQVIASSLEDENFRNLGCVYLALNISYDEYKDYEEIVNIASIYSDITDDLINWHTKTKTFSATNLSSLAYEIIDFYEYFDSSKYSFVTAADGDNLYYKNKMRTNLESMLIAYMGLTQEDIETLDTWDHDQIEQRLKGATGIR